jgi:EutQ-like cupin domain
VHDGETTHVLVAGSVAYFPRGLTTVWEVPTYVKKAFVLRATPAPSVLDRLKSLWLRPNAR